MKRIPPKHSSRPRRSSAWLSSGYDGNLNTSFGLNGSRRAAVAAKNDVEARLWAQFPHAGEERP